MVQCVYIKCLPEKTSLKILNAENPSLIDSHTEIGSTSTFQWFHYKFIFMLIKSSSD